MPDARVRLNELSLEAAREALTRCCGAVRWVEHMLARRPFESSAVLYRAADEVWSELDRTSQLEAFAHHPKIGEDLAALREKFGSTVSWAQHEQSGVQSADEPTLLALRDENQAYFERFGFIFIVCATGKSAAEMLALLRARLHNEPAFELAVAAREQAKITKLRLEKLA